jgi:hypothetical protein
VVDYWSAFARTGDPNPEGGYLQAMGYWNSIAQIGVSGAWEKVDVGKPKQKLMQWDSSGVVGFGEGDQCEVLGLGVGYYEE